jgi:hypothetical protein
MDVHLAGLPSDDALLLSLRTIQRAKTQLHLSTASDPTPTALASRIRLCDVLLGEIRAIRTGLEDRMRCRGMIHRRSVGAKRIRSTRHPSIPHGNPANRSGYPR